MNCAVVGAWRSLSILLSLHQMERLTLVLIALFVILFLGQVYLREYFVTTVDISNSTLTMSLTDLLYTLGTKMPSPPGSHLPYPPPPPHHSHHNDNELEQYLLMKEELLKGVKSGLDSSLPALKKKYKKDAEDDVSPSCSQGSAYMENVPLVLASSC